MYFDNDYDLRFICFYYKFYGPDFKKYVPARVRHKEKYEDNK